nr:hypothetical protein [Nocardioidaceae bacterium]
MRSFVCLAGCAGVLVPLVIVVSPVAGEPATSVSVSTRSPARSLATAPVTPTVRQLPVRGVAAGWRVSAGTVAQSRAVAATGYAAVGAVW